MEAKSHYKHAFNAYWDTQIMVFQMGFKQTYSNVDTLSKKYIARMDSPVPTAAESALTWKSYLSWEKGHFTMFDILSPNRKNFV